MGSQPTKSRPPVVHKIENNQTKLKEKAKVNKDDIDNDDEINLEDFVIVWLDDDPIDHRLKSLNTVTKSFTDTQRCVSYIENIHNELIFLIIGRVTLARPLLYLKQDCRQLQCIYVLCIRQPELIEEWKDAKIFTDIPSLIQSLEVDIKLSKNGMIRIRPIKEPEDLIFVWHYLFFQLIHQLEPPLNAHKDKLFQQLKFFYHNDEKEKEIIGAFQRNYRSQYALWWLTRKHKFLSFTLNKALRVKDYNHLCAYRFYLKDLYNQMIELKPSMISNEYIVYLSQKLNSKETNKLSSGSLILIETFLFTKIICPETKDTIIEIHIKEKTRHPFVRLNENGDLVFYPMSVFRLDYIKEKFLRLVMDQQTDQKVDEILNNAIEKHSLEPQNPIKMGLALWKLDIGTIKQAYTYHLMLLEQLPPKNCLDLANLHNNLAGILKDNGSYRRSLTHYEIAEKLYLKSVSHNHLYLSPTYVNIANVYRLKGKHSESLKYHLKALEIREKTLPSNHIQIGESLMEVALTYHELGLNISSIPLLYRTKEIYQSNQIPKNDLRYKQLQEAFNLCQAI